MARTNLPQTALTANAGIAAPAGTTIDATNGMNMTNPTTGIPAAPNFDRLLLVVANTAGAPKNVIIRAGVGGGATAGQAFRSGIGDLTVSVTNGTTAYIGPFDPSRFVQLDGSLNIDFASGTTGTITALILPARF